MKKKDLSRVGKTNFLINFSHQKNNTGFMPTGKGFHHHFHERKHISGGAIKWVILVVILYFIGLGVYSHVQINNARPAHTNISRKVRKPKRHVQKHHKKLTRAQKIAKEQKARQKALKKAQAKRLAKIKKLQKERTRRVSNVRNVRNVRTNVNYTRSNNNVRNAR